MSGHNRTVSPEKAAARIAELALSFPQAYEDRPFGDFPTYKVPPNKLFALALNRSELIGSLANPSEEALETRVNELEGQLRMLALELKKIKQGE